MRTDDSPTFNALSHFALVPALWVLIRSFKYPTTFLIRSQTMTTRSLRKVAIDVDSGDWHRHSSETIWVKTTEVEDEFVVANTPFFARDLSFGDRIKARKTGDQLAFHEVVSRGGHSTYRVIPTRHGGKISDINEALELLGKEGCRFERGQIGDMPFVVVDIPPESSADRCHEIVGNADKAGTLHFQIAHDGHP